MLKDLVRNSTKSRDFFFDRPKKYEEKSFSEKVFFTYFVNKLCGMRAKYEGITPKTPKVRLIFDFFSGWRFFLQPLQRYRGGQLSEKYFSKFEIFDRKKNIFHQNFYFDQKHIQYALSMPNMSV